MSLFPGTFRGVGATASNNLAAKEWEYKIVAANANVATTVERQEAILNGLGKQGWIFIQNEGGWLYFKRAKK